MEDVVIVIDDGGAGEGEIPRFVSDAVRKKIDALEGPCIIDTQFGWVVKGVKRYDVR